jgi:tetratricopeptide (TPR) repeat protein
MFGVREADLLVYLRRHDEAIATYEAVLGRAPADSRALFGLSDALRAAGRLAEAVEARHRAHRRLRDLAGIDEGVVDDAEQELRRLDRLSADAELAALRARAVEGRYVSPLDAARQYARRGDTDAAARQFAAALADRAPGLTMLDVDHAWDGMRADTRFQDLRARVGLP